MIPGVAYRRVSTKEQKKAGFSLPAQDKDNREYAAKNGIEIVADFYDAETGKVATRAGWQQTLEYLRSGKAKALICVKNDRVFRNELEYMILRHELKNLGVELHYSRRGKVDLDSVGGQIIEDIEGRLAVEELRVMQERSMRSKYEMAQEGHVMTHGRYPYGYRLAKTTLVLYEPEAEVVRKIYEWYVYERLSARAIAFRLTEAMIPTRGDAEPEKFPRKRRGVGEWGRSAVNQILKNPTYRGVWYYGKTGKNPTPVPVPRIVEDDLWYAAQRILETNRDHKRKQSTKEYLLAWHIKCTCGTPMSGHQTTYTTKQGKKHIYYYRCQRTTGSEHETLVECHAPQFRVSNLDYHVWERLKAWLRNEQALREELEAAKEEEKERLAPILTELDATGGLIKDKRTRLNKLLELYLDGRFDKSQLDVQHDELTTTIANLEARKGELQNQLTSARLTTQTIETILDVREQLEEIIEEADREDGFPGRRLFVEGLNVQVKPYVEDGTKKAHMTWAFRKQDIIVLSSKSWAILGQLHITFEAVVSLAVLSAPVPT